MVNNGRIAGKSQAYLSMPTGLSVSFWPKDNKCLTPSQPRLIRTCVGKGPKKPSSEEWANHHASLQSYVELLLPLVISSPHNTCYLAIFSCVQIPNTVRALDIYKVGLSWRNWIGGKQSNRWQTGGIAELPTKESDQCSRRVQSSVDTSVPRWARGSLLN